MRRRTEKPLFVFLTSVTKKSMTIAFRAAGATRAALSLAAHSSREMVRSSRPPACVDWCLFFYFY
jgi:hypothetical protein